MILLFVEIYYKYILILYINLAFELSQYLTTTVAIIIKLAKTRLHIKFTQTLSVYLFCYYVNLPLKLNKKDQLYLQPIFK